MEKSKKEFVRMPKEDGRIRYEFKSMPPREKNFKLRLCFYAILVFLLLIFCFTAWLELSFRKDELRWIEEDSQRELSNMRFDSLVKTYKNLAY